MTTNSLNIDGARKREHDSGRSRIVLGMGMFALCYLAIAARLMVLAAAPEEHVVYGYGAEESIAASRPDIVDRNGEILATDIKVPSLYANPSKIIDVDEAVDALTRVLPELDRRELRKDLSSDRSFVFVKRELTPAKQAEIHALGIPALGFIEESRRVYPSGPTAAHVLGLVSVDHVGLAGIEKHIEDQGLAALRAAGFTAERGMPAEQLSIDLRVQYAMRAELAQAMETFSAKAAAGVIMDARTGEVVAMTSLPDYDPNHGAGALDPEAINRVTTGVYELGSIIKAFTVAMALDTGAATLTDTYDARRPLRVASFTISDFHPENRVLSVAEVFTHSSNIGSARMALQVGKEGHRAFLEKMGLLDRLRTELPESAQPLVPAKWREITTMTAAFGHGFSTSPLQAVTAAAALVNGGMLMEPTFLPRTREQAAARAHRVLNPATSEAMRHLFRLNVEDGTAGKAEAPGYLVGGKTGTAEKIIKGRYSKDKRLTSFLGAFPMDDPRYVILVMLDEPQPTKDTFGYATAGWNAVPVSGTLISRVAPMLGVMPRVPRAPEPLLVGGGETITASN